MSTIKLPHKRVAITGASGQLGQELTRRMGATAIPMTRRDLDITNSSQTREALLRAEPELVINAAAYTSVDRAENEPELCFAINARAVESLASVCAEIDCPLVQISTDYVFGGDQQRRVPYSEIGQPSPINVYGRSKLVGEQAAASWHKHIIVRTSGLYASAPAGPQWGRNFADTMMVLGRERKSLRLVNDQVCTPTFVPHFADMLMEILATGKLGVFHATNGGATTWFGFADELFQQAGIVVRLEPITSAEYGAAAPRPAYSILEPSTVLTASPNLLPPWQRGLSEYLAATRGAGRP